MIIGYKCDWFFFYIFIFSEFFYINIFLSLITNIFLFFQKIKKMSFFKKNENGVTFGKSPTIY